VDPLEEPMSGADPRFWWGMLSNTFNKPVREFIAKAQAAEKRVHGHDCGHQFEITVRSALHTSGPGEHRDADWWGDSGPVIVRAHNLRDALLIAAALPLPEWVRFDDEQEDEA
jgi:hypothetical protein